MALQSVINGRDQKRQRTALVAAFSKLKEGQSITREELTSIIGEPAKSGRYYSILYAARKEFFESTGVTLETVQGAGVRYPTGEEQMALGRNGCRRAGRLLYRSTKTIARISDDRLSDPHLRTERDHRVQAFEYLHQRMALETKPSIAQKALPEK